jgi:hypothetical protein
MGHPVPIAIIYTHRNFEQGEILASPYPGLGLDIDEDALQTFMVPELSLTVADDKLLGA